MSNTQRMIRLTEAEIQEHIEAGLMNLRHICKVYDEGHPYIAFAMATEIQRILDSNEHAQRLRGSKNFPTPKSTSDRSNLAVEPKLIMIQVSGDPPVVDFVPVFRGGIADIVLLKCRDWWGKDVIYRASAAQPGMPPDLIPVRAEDQVPYDDRETLVREAFVDLMRDKLGAHLDVEIPETLHDLQKSYAFGIDVAISTPAGEISVSEGTLPVRTGPAAAMMRQISQEVLVAYGLEGIWTPGAVAV